MKKLFVLLFFVSLILVPLKTLFADEPVGVSFIYPVQFPPVDESLTMGRFNLLYGYNKNLTGVDLGFIGNGLSGNLKGSQLSCFMNYVAGEADVIGIQATGLFNINLGKSKVRGVQLSGLANILNETSEVMGVQFSSITNVSVKSNKITGAQIAGATNINLEGSEIDGVQYGTFLNYELKEIKLTGAQISVATNIAFEGAITGLQLSTAFNAINAVTGAQVGIVNIAKKVVGTQIGIFNYTEYLDGIQIGLCNYAGNGAMKMLPVINFSFN